MDPSPPQAFLGPALTCALDPMRPDQPTPGSRSTLRHRTKATLAEPGLAVPSASRPKGIEVRNLRESEQSLGPATPGSQCGPVSQGP